MACLARSDIMGSNSCPCAIYLLSNWRMMSMISVCPAAAPFAVWAAVFWLMLLAISGIRTSGGMSNLLREQVAYDFCSVLLTETRWAAGGHPLNTPAPG